MSGNHGNAASRPLETSEKPKKPLILSQSKWDEILEHYQRGDDVKVVSEADRQYKKHLREESHAMTNKWGNPLKTIIEAKDEKRLEREGEQFDEAAGRFVQFKENDVIKHCKEFTRRLGSAYNTREYVAVRLQRINAKSETRKRDLESAMGRDATARDEQIGDQQKFNITESRRAQDKYKKVLRQFIENKDRQHAELKNDKCEEERLERNWNDSDLAAQMCRERRVLEKKKEAKRIIALEAMQMAEMRRIREKNEEALKNKMPSIFSGYANINESKNEKRFVCVKERFSSNAFADIKNIQVNKDESVDRTAVEFDAKLKFKDQAKVEEKRRIKQMQIKNYLDDIAREKIRKQRKENELKREIENRVRNEEVKIEFDRHKRLETMMSIKEHRRIMEQMEERKQKDREKEHSDLVSLNEMNVQEDKVQKNHPVYPLQKVIDECKHMHNVNSKKFVYGVDELKAMRPNK